MYPKHLFTIFYGYETFLVENKQIATVEFVYNEVQGTLDLSSL